MTAKTGLLLDPYFSATKIAWILDNVDGRKSPRGTRRTGLRHHRQLSFYGASPAGEQHATDATNAARTLLFNIHENEWDEELLSLFRVPRQLLAGGARQQRRFRHHARRQSLRPSPCQFWGSPATSRPPPLARPASAPA